jgi:hypothetical protein
MNNLTWRDIFFNLNTYTEGELQVMIESERHGKRRRSILVRLHQRYCILRANREREEILD